MNRLVRYIAYAVLVISCGTSGSTVPAPVTPEKDGREITLTVDNPTIFNVYIEGDFGKRINKKSTNNTVTLLVEDGPLSGGFNILYEIPLSNAVTLFYKGDHRTFREEQKTFQIDEPREIEKYGTYISLDNRAKNAISFYTDGTLNQALEQKGSPENGNILRRSSKREFNPHDTVVFSFDFDSIQGNHSVRDGGKRIPLIIPQSVKNNYCYSYEYRVDTVTLTDARPLHRIGEEAWVNIINNATSPMPLVVDDREINLFASTDRGIIRNVYDSAGKAIQSAPSGDAFNITYASKAENGFFVAGFNRRANGDYQPAVKVYNKDGSIRSILEPSTDYKEARYFTAAQKDNATWLLAGDGMKRGKNDYTAYARMVRIENDKLTAVWELGANDFEDNRMGIQGGDVQSAVYNHDHWLVTGENIKNSGSYLAEINENGKIKFYYSFKDMLFYTILTDTNGICYLAGKEQRGNETYAILGKYNLKDHSFQKITDAPAHSYYHDALLDTENNRIVLGGVLKAKDESGYGGTPFIDIVDIPTGTLRREELSHPEIKKAGAALVTAISPAPDYGFALSLSGISGTTDNYDEPYIIARVNSQGKYIKEAEK